MSRSFSFFLAATLAASVLFSAGCDDALPADPDPDPDPDPVGATIDAEALAQRFGCDVSVVETNVETDGALDAEGDCTLDDGRMVDYYAFSLDEDAAPFYVEAFSDEFDTVVYLYAEDGTYVGENDDMGEGNTDSVLAMPLDAAVYVAAVAPFDPDQSGAYRFVTKR